MNINFGTINWYSVLVTVALVILGYIVSYLKARSDLISKAATYINVAEENYKSFTKAGNQKFEFVVDTLYNWCPAPLKIFITRKMISDIVQKVFDQIQEFANKQLDKAVDKIVDQN